MPTPPRAGGHSQISCIYRHTTQSQGQAYIFCICWYTTQSQEASPDFLAAPTGSEVSQILLQQLGYVRKLVYHWYMEPDKSPQGRSALNHFWPLNQAAVIPLIWSNESKMFHFFFWEMDSQGNYSLWRWVLTPISLKLNVGEQNRQNLTELSC